MLLFGAAAGDFFLLLLGSRDAAPAHRQADAEGEDQGCEAGEHCVVLDAETNDFIPRLQAFGVPGLRWSARGMCFWWRAVGDVGEAESWEGRTGRRRCFPWTAGTVVLRLVRDVSGE